MQSPSSQLPQYRLSKILLVWAAAAFPMAILGWVVAPALTVGSDKPGFERMAVLGVGLVWQFALVLTLIYKESGAFSFREMRRRLWLRSPSTKSGESRTRLWWWIIPVAALTGMYQMQIGGSVQRAWVALFPLFAEPSGFSLSAALNTPGAGAALVGHWSLFFLALASAAFNTVLGEELLFRGLLLPRMSGVFGKWDWLANGTLFGLYHLHQPWGMFNSAIQGTFFYALPTRYFRSAWFGIIAHSGQSLFFAFLILGLVVGAR